MDILDSSNVEPCALKNASTVWDGVSDVSS